MGDDLLSATPRPARLTLRGLAERVQDEVFNLHRGLPGTWLQLAWRPGATIRRYVEWRDPRLTPPIRYLLVNLALCALLASLFGLGDDMLEGVARGYDGVRTRPDAGGGARMARVLQHLDVGLVLAGIPAMAAALERGYRQWMNLAEALAFATFVLAQISSGLLLLALLLVVGLRIEHGGVVLGVLALWPLYFAWASYGYFASHGAGIARALGTMMLMVALLLMLSLSLVFIGLGIVTLA